MPNDVALHFGRARFDRVSARTQIAVRPKPFVDCMPVTCQELAVGTENLLRDLLETLVELAPEDFLDRAFGARDSRGRNAAEGAHLVETHDFNFRDALRQLLAGE